MQKISPNIARSNICLCCQWLSKDMLNTLRLASAVFFFAAAMAANTPTDVLVLGHLGSGKTRLLSFLRHAASRNRADAKIGLKDQPSLFSSSTVGVEVDYISGWLKKRGKRSLGVREVGAPMIPMWNKYYTDCHCIVYMVDVSNLAQVAESAVELWKLLTDLKRKGKTVPLLCLLNKAESVGRVSTEDIGQYFLFDTIRNHDNGFVPDSENGFTVMETSLVGEVETSLAHANAVLNWACEAVPGFS